MKINEIIKKIKYDIELKMISIRIVL